MFEVEGYSFAEIMNTVVKPWIPHVFVLHPKRLAEKSIKDVEQWLDKAKSVFQA